MRPLLATELLKLRTVRASYVLVLATLGLVGLFVTVAVSTMSSPPPTHAIRDTLDVAGIAIFLALVLGILLAAGEYYHGTITQSLLTTPIRRRLVVGKVVLAAAAGLVMALAAEAVALAIDAIGSALTDLSFSVSEDGVPRVLATTLVAAALWGALGAAVGSVVPSQTGALAGVVLWFFVVESILSGLVPRVGRFTPGGALGALTGNHGEDQLSPWAGGALAAGYVVLLTIAGLVTTERRDIA